MARKKVIDKDNPYGLTANQQEFCNQYINKYNATQAYLNAYDVTYNTAKNNGPKLLANTCIKKEIKRLKKKLNKDTFVDTKDLFIKYLKIAFSDIGDYIEWDYKIEKHRDMFGNVLKDENGEDRTYIKNFVKVKSSSKVDTSLVQEVSSGKDGFKIKLADKKQAFDYLEKHFKDLSGEEGEKFPFTLEEIKKATEMYRKLKDD